MFQLSLRSMLVLMALVALAIVSLRFASEGWQTLVLALAMIALSAAIVMAVVDRGERQAFAIGFAIAMVSYALVLKAIPLEGVDYHRHQEFNPDTGSLPTTRLLLPVYRAIAEVRYMQFTANGYQEVKNFDPKTQSTGGGGFGGARISMNETPSRRLFMTIGHTWWAILLGLCGGMFARWVYLRRTREPLAAGRS